MGNYIKQVEPFQLPIEDGLVVEEYFGKTSVDAPFSLAKLSAPPFWYESVQVTKFDEYVCVINGVLQINIDDEKVILEEGQSIRIMKGCRMQFSNPTEEEIEYLAIYLPAFSFNKLYSGEQ